MHEPDNYHHNINIVYLHYKNNNKNNNGECWASALTSLRKRMQFIFSDPLVLSKPEPWARRHEQCCTLLFC